MEIGDSCCDNARIYRGIWGERCVGEWCGVYTYNIFVIIGFYWAGKMNTQNTRSSIVGL